MDPTLIFRDLSHPLRLRILIELLDGDELCVSDLQYSLLVANQQTVSENLGSLRRSGLVRCRREGTFRYYSLVPSEGSEFLRSVFACVECCRQAAMAEDEQGSGRLS